MLDITASLQRQITEASSKRRPADQEADADFMSIELDGGDYGVQMIQIPKGGKVALHSKDRVRLLYIGKRNRPMFELAENSVLYLKGKLEIYYNTNNMQEVMRLMIRCPPSSSVEISKDVKVSFFSQKVQ